MRDASRSVDLIAPKQSNGRFPVREGCARLERGHGSIRPHNKAARILSGRRVPVILDDLMRELGPEVEILEPAALRREIATRAARMAAQYQ